jgi:hypothetical protein
MTIVQTPSGKTLPLMNLKGKDYLAVAYRLVWYREIYPKGKIVTEAIQMTPEYAIFRASIFDESERLLATATKHESKKDFPDHIEKAETGAIGRALALCGFGTQFTDELDEGERIVDSPILAPTKKNPQNGPVSPIKKPETFQTTNCISAAQAKRLHAIASKFNWKPDELKAHLVEKLGVDSSLKIPREKYDWFCDSLGNEAPGNGDVSL